MNKSEKQEISSSTSLKLENTEKKKLKIPNELRDFSEYLYKPKYFFIRNLFAGFARGIGVFLGLTVGVAVATWLVTQLVDFPLVGEYFSRLLDILETNTPSIR